MSVVAKEEPASEGGREHDLTFIEDDAFWLKFTKPSAAGYVVSFASPNTKGGAAGKEHPLAADLGGGTGAADCQRSHRVKSPSFLPMAWDARSHLM